MQGRERKEKRKKREKGNSDLRVIAFPVVSLSVETGGYTGKQKGYGNSATRCSTRRIDEAEKQT